MSLLMKAGVSLTVFWQGTSKPLPLVVDLFHFQDTLDWTLHLFGWKFSVSCSKIICSFPAVLGRGFIAHIVLSWSNPKLIGADLP